MTYMCEDSERPKRTVFRTGTDELRMVTAERLMRLFVASVFAPGLPSIVAYLVVERFGIVLADNVGHQAFLTEAVMFYVSALPGFLMLYTIKASIIWYLIVGMFATWPLWILMMGLPSDASVDPVNPQFFLAPTTAISGLICGLLFFFVVNVRWRVTRNTTG